MEQWRAEDQLCCCWTWRGLGSHQGWQCKSNDDDDDDDDDQDDDDNQDEDDNDGDAVEDKEEDDDGRDFSFGQVMLREGTALRGSGRWVEFFFILELEIEMESLDFSLFFSSSSVDG